MGVRMPFPHDVESVEDRVARPYRDCLRSVRHVLSQRAELLVTEDEATEQIGRLIAGTLGEAP